MNTKVKLKAGSNGYVTYCGKLKALIEDITHSGKTQKLVQLIYDIMMGGNDTRINIHFITAETQPIDIMLRLLKLFHPDVNFSHLTAVGLESELTKLSRNSSVYVTIELLTYENLRTADMVIATRLQASLYKDKHVILIDSVIQKQRDFDEIEPLDGQFIFCTKNIALSKQTNY